MKDKFAFDNRVAQSYSTYRAHPPEVSEQVGKVISTLAGENARVLEVGIGTGRIAIPVMNAGGEVIGIDLSREMLNEVALTAQSGGTLAVSQADMHFLPFPDNSFDAAMMVHVIHLTPKWQDVLREIARVLRPGGVLIRGDDWIDPQSAIGSMRNALRRHVIDLAPEFLPPSAMVSKEDFLSELGGTEHSEQTAAAWTVQMSPAEHLDKIDRKVDPESWVLPDELYQKVRQYMHDYAAEQWSDVNAPQPVNREFRLKITRGNW